MASPAIWIGTYGLGALAVLAAGVPLLLVARRWKLAGLAALLLAGITAAAIASIAGPGAAAAINGKGLAAPQTTPITNRRGARSAQVACDGQNHVVAGHIEKKYHKH